MKTYLIGLSAIALAAGATGGIAAAKDHAHGMDPMDGKTVTRAQAQAHAAQMFARMDVNQDGQIDQADRAARGDEHFAKLDANKDGAVSKGEFDAARQARMAARKAGEGQGERAGRMGGHGKRGGGMAMMLLHMADTNKDRAVTRAEFEAAHARHLDMVDANKDGQITPEERTAAHARMRDHMKMMRGMGAGGHEGHEGHTPPPPGK